MAEKRGDVDDTAGCVGLSQPVCGLSCHPPTAIQVDVDRSQPVLLGKPRCRGGNCDAGIADDDIDGAEYLLDGIECSADGIAVGNVHGDCLGLPAVSADCVGDLDERPAAPTAWNDTGTGFGQGVGETAAQAAPPPVTIATRPVRSK